MAIYKFRQIYQSINEELGPEKAEELFPEFNTLPNELPVKEQIELVKVLMNRLDKNLTKDQVIKVRRKHPCNPTSKQVYKIKEIKAQYPDLPSRLKAYSEYLNLGYSILDGDIINVRFGIKYCVCPLLRKSNDYDKMPVSWCECCNAHTIKMFERVLDHKIDSEIVQTIACGGSDCDFKMKILK